MILKYPDRKLSNNDVANFPNCGCNCIHHLLCANAQWLSKTGKPCSGFSVCGEDLMPMEDCWISKSFLISVQFVHQLQSLNCRLLHFAVHFSHTFSKVHLQNVTKTTFTKIVVIRQWKLITRLNLIPDIELIVNHPPLLGCCSGYFTIRSELCYFWTNFVKPRTHILNEHQTEHLLANLVCLPNGFVKNCLASTYGKCEQTNCHTVIGAEQTSFDVYSVINIDGTLPNANEGIHHRWFAFAVPFTYTHFRQTNAFVCRSFGVCLIYVYAA